MSQKYDSSSTKHFWINHNFGLFQDTFVSIFKTKRPSDYFAFFSFLLCGGQAYFYIFVFGLLGSTTGRGPHFFFFFTTKIIRGYKNPQGQTKSNNKEELVDTMKFVDQCVTYRCSVGLYTVCVFHHNDLVARVCN